MISMRARYAMHGVGFLAHRHHDAPIPFAEILEHLRSCSRDLGFSRGYIAKIFHELCRAGITTAVVGRKGGYALARRPRDVRIVEVVEAMDGYPRTSCCLLSVGGGCRTQDTCQVRQMIRGAEKAFHGFLARETAASLAETMFRGHGPGKGPRARRRKARTPRGVRS